MRTLFILLAALFLPACATLRGGRSDAGERTRLWQAAHAAYHQDSFRVAAAAFQRLATDYPRTPEGHEARFYLGVLSLEPRSAVDLTIARQHLQLYVGADTMQETRGYHGREAASLLRLVSELQRPCDVRVGALACETRVVTRPGAPEPAAPTGGSENSAEAARLRREVAERDQTIKDLREELQRIRNTLAPRRQP
ncbi:MAG: hypothetical protein AVDCRST_MAG68-4766 [uncultured Gemmatimonadetes bacterium]|uniref:Outer membrane lipoprotein BamD-like domain-containing protein n=1 Tax=uncultured Gemmatimonadota bacterium TaxID=203437 RepID=A0A6J4ML15_9BACT|nr:MAG: hypothetical protein AVDCRST_MAG68-4766 [uncultured Gemmatimonadota bacterium]